MRPGVKVSIGGQELVAPSLSTRDLILLDDQDRAFAALDRDPTVRELVERAQRIPRASLLRNYPQDLVDQAIGDADLTELVEAGARIFEVTFGGRKATASGEDPSPAI